AGHEAHEMGHFNGMVQNVLGVAVAEMEPAENFQNLEVQRRQAGFGDGLFGEAKDGFVHLLVDNGDNFLDATGMNSAIDDEALHGFASDFAADGIEAGKQNCAGGVVDEDGDAGSGFEGANVAPFAANDAAFDVVALKGNGGGGVFEGVFAGVTLNG